MPNPVKCSHCDYQRAFSPELGGRYYRCPRECAGVLAVPLADEESFNAWRSSHDDWIRDSAQRLGVDLQETSAASREAREAEAPEVDAGTEDPAERPNNRGRVASVRRVLVQCELCSFLVQIPLEFFGKTVHCPGCAANNVFTESTLEPLKDEILDRLLLDSTERDALAPGDAGEGRGVVRPLVIGTAVGMLILAGALLLRKLLG